MLILAWKEDVENSRGGTERKEKGRERGNLPKKQGKDVREIEEGTTCR
jgi:hypothetical protein